MTAATVPQSNVAVIHYAYARGTVSNPNTLNSRTLPTKVRRSRIISYESRRVGLRTSKVIQIIFGALFVVSLTDSVSVSESMLKTVVKIRLETFALTETRLKKSIKLRSDTMANSETSTRILIKVRSLSDTLTKSESLLKKAIKARSDTMAKSETLTKIASKLRTLSDTYTRFESITKRATLKRTDSVSNSDNISKIRTVVRNRTDSVSYSDGLSIRLRKLLADTYGVTESLRKTASKLITDTLGKSETLTGGRVSNIITRALSDTYGGSESIIKSATKIITEVWTASESNVTLRVFKRALSETYGTTEIVKIKISRYLVDAYGFSEQLSKSAGKLLSDALGKSESLTSQFISSAIVRTLSDTYNYGEFILKSVVYNIIDVIGGGGGFKQFIHHLVDTYLASETLQSFILRVSAPLDTVGYKPSQQMFARNIRTVLQSRLAKPQEPDMPLLLSRRRIAARTLSDSYVTTESIQTTVYRRKSKDRVVDDVKEVPISSNRFTTRQLPASAITETIIKKLKASGDSQIAAQFQDRVKLQQLEQQKLKVVKQVENSLKLITKDNTEHKIMKARKLAKLMKLTKLIDLIRRVGANTERET